MIIINIEIAQRGLPSWGKRARAWLDQGPCQLALPARTASRGSPDRACLDKPPCQLALPARKAQRASPDRACLDKPPCQLHWLARCRCQRQPQRLAYRRACVARSATMCLHRLGHASNLVIISIRITASGLGYPRAQDRPERPRPTHFDRLGLSESLAESPETPRVAPSGSTGPLRVTKVD